MGYYNLSIEEIDKLWDSTLVRWCEHNGEYGRQLREEYMSDDNKVILNSVGEIVPYANHDIELIWKCKFGHVWKESPYSRTRNKTQCKECIKINTLWDEAIKLNKVYESCVNKNATGTELNIDELRHLKEKYTYKELEKITGKSIATLKRRMHEYVIPKDKYTIVDWCIDNSRQDILEQWDFEKNLLELGKTLKTAVNKDNVVAPLSA